ncbi:MAG: Thymidylate kinase [Holophagaceae bacterium]|nr:Thymidylate kinase [Holophagaceae bacterium]
MPNRLIESTSPYLLQHAHNPVDWRPWNPESLALARKLDRPIFLSVGYSACHWCHVMERESFEDAGIAAFLNKHFVPIKVDREERPDLDDLYMGAVQLMTGRGGWPMSVWLTPDLEPFYGGTYFPPTARGGMPGFLEVLEAVAMIWQERRQEVLSQAGELMAALRRSPGQAGEGPVGGLADAVVRHLRQTFDPRWGGFGGAPKFPPIPALTLLLGRKEPRDMDMALATLDAMAAGGIRDHLGGGFARYSVDGHWKVPHFEKMLYDNAQLAWVYLEAFRVTGVPRHGERAREILDYLLEDMRDGAGGFHSSEDADSEGEEGRFYTFTWGEIHEVLGSDAELFCLAYGVTPEGNFEGGRNLLHRLDGGDFPEAGLAPLRDRLRIYRNRRARPHRDDKVLAAWNAFALSALAKGSCVLGDPRYLEAAEACADFLQRELWRGSSLMRTWRRGRAHTPAFLEDYGALILGLLDLYQAGFRARWLPWARELGEVILERFQDPAGGFFGTEARDVVLRQHPVFDQAVPSGNALAALALLRLGRHWDRADFTEAARRTLARFAPELEDAPQACLGLLRVLEEEGQETLEAVVSGDPSDPLVVAFLEVLHRRLRPGQLLSLVASDPELPLHGGRGSLAAAVHLCRGRACMPPVRNVGELSTALDEADLAP